MEVNKSAGKSGHPSPENINICLTSNKNLYVKVQTIL